MGIDYSFNLCFGFELDCDIVEAPFYKTEQDPGLFHMEDRFDPKTGAKVDPVKVWDRKPSPKRWVEVDGEKCGDMDPEDWERFFRKRFDCNVDQYGSWPSGELTYVFYVNTCQPWREAADYGKVTVFNSVISIEEMPSLMVKALKLKEKLEAHGYNPGEPQVFIATRIS